MDKNKKKKNKYKVLDLFCGAGGLSCGFEMAGFDIVGGIDFDKASIETHEHNFKNSFSYCGDIKKFSNDNIKKHFASEVDVIIGGPPCQGFSSANMQQKDIKNDPRNKLFFEFIRFVKIIKPKAFVIENVRGILSKDNGFAKEKIYELLGKEGYIINSDVLIASEYGVPQKRVRAVFVGLRKDLLAKFDFNKLQKKEKVTVKDAISDLYKITEKQVDENGYIKLKNEPNTLFQKMLRSKNNEIFNHEIAYPNEKVQERMSYVPQGGNWKDVPTNLWDRQRDNRHSSAYKRLDEKDISVTIDTGHMNYFHPLYNRIPTVRESARLQSFPDGFVFIGNKGEQFRQVGNAVPPLLAKAVGDLLKKYLDKEEGK